MGYLGYLGRAVNWNFAQNSQEGIECTKAKEQLRAFCPKIYNVLYLLPTSFIIKIMGFATWTRKKRRKKKERKQTGAISYSSFLKIRADLTKKHPEIETLDTRFTSCKNFPLKDYLNFMYVSTHFCVSKLKITVLILFEVQAISKDVAD